MTEGVQAPSYVVGIGASAGGLDALERFFDNLPGDTGMAFVVVQHLSPDFKSLMDELLARHTQLPIRLVEDGMPVEADRVYLIPPKKEMIISGGRLLLSDRDRHQELSLPIDVFFRSLAQDCGYKAVAIVLSGGGSDGSRGIRAIHEAGGLVMVQDFESAQFDGMPKTARDAGVAHIVCAPQDMPRALLDHVRARRAGTGSEPQPIDVHGLGAIYRVLEGQFGIDFTVYKPTTVTRRIERRLALAHSPDLDEYVARLRSDRDELDILYRDLLIGVTSFFRDKEAYELLEHRILPELLQREPREAPLRLWVAGCATGEEPYSLAIVLQDLMSRVGERPVKIFATDVHRGSLEHAARGLYEDEAVTNVSRERLERYFLRLGNSWQVIPEVRQMVVFAAHNVIKDPPFTRVDLISCRNLLIYFQPHAQQKVLSLFHFALNRAGTLFLGPSESTGPLAYGFESIDKPWQLYRKHSDVRVPVDTRLQPLTAETRMGSAPTTPARHSLSELISTYDALLEDVMPPSLLVTDHGELVHVFGGASRFLRVRDGRQGLDVLEVVDSELKMVLMGALKRVSNEPGAIVFKGVRLGIGEEEAAYQVTVRRVRGRGATNPHVLVSFEAMEGFVRRPAAVETELDLDQLSREQLGALEAELSRAKENLQASNEELQASNEELQASNEELQSSNEELQSTNEELQSVNEELYTVNAEYQRKIAELSELTNDMDNLLASTEVGTIFLDPELRIRKFTPQIGETFDLVPHDVGRPIGTFAHKMDYPELVQDLERVLATGTPVERERRDVRGRSFFLRILPYRKKGRVEGVVLTLIDVTGLKNAEDALFHERYLLNSLLSTVPDAIGFKDTRGRFIRANERMVAHLGLEGMGNVAGKTAFELPDGHATQLHREDQAVLRTGKPEHNQLTSRTGADGSPAWDLVTRLPLKDTSDQIVGLIVISRDVTEQKRAEARTKEAVRLRDQFLAMLSHELRNPLGAIVTATGLLKSEAIRANRAPSKMVEILERQSQQMARLLDDLLEASRVTQNKIELRRRVVDLGAVAREAADAVRGQMESRGLRLTTDIAARPLFVNADPARLQQIHVNLLSNASKYTPPGGAVELIATVDAGEALIRVRDDGVGINKEMLDTVFDLFVQSNRTLDRAAGGLGVGLTLVRSLVTMHGGSVSAHSEGEGRGSEFVVRLPLTRASPDDEGLLSRRSRVPAAAQVLIVEDNADSRELLCEVLENAGFVVRTAESGTAGLALIDELRPDIAILDVGLPEMDGFELARRIRSRPDSADTCLIALTGYGQPSDRATAREAGFDEHIVKPVSPEVLVELLDQLRGADSVPPSAPG